MNTSAQSTEDDVHVRGALGRSGLSCPHFIKGATETGTQEAAGLTKIRLAFECQNELEGGLLPSLCPFSMGPPEGDLTT